MASSLFEGNSNLSNIDYTKLVEKIIEIDTNKAELSDQKRIYFDKDSLEIKNLIHIAGEVAQELFNSDILVNNPKDCDALSKATIQCNHLLDELSINLQANPRKICSNFNDPSEQEKAFKELKKHFSNTLLKDIEESRNEGHFDTSYPFRNTLTNNEDAVKPLEKLNFNLINTFRHISIPLCEMEYKNDINPRKNGVIRTDTFLVEAEIDNLEYNLLSALLNHYGKKYSRDEDKKEELKALINENSDIVQKLKKFIIGLRNGYLKRTGQFLYLDCLRKYFISLNYHEEIEVKEQYDLFNNYVDRFFKFEALMEDILINSRMDEFGLDYNGMPYDFKGNGADLTYLFRESHIYSSLPFIGAISDPLSDSTDSKRENGQELYGINTKMNGNVAKENKISYEYHLASLEGFAKEDYKLKEGRKSGAELAKALLFKFFLLELDNPNYDPVTVLEEDIEIMRDTLGNEEDIKAKILEIHDSITTNNFSINEHLSKIKNIIRLGLSNKTPFSYSYERTLSLLTSMLPDDISQPTRGENILNIMHTKGFHPSLIKYTTLFDDEFIDASVFSFNYKFTITSNLIQPKSSKDKNFEMAYDDIKDRGLTNFILFPQFPRSDFNRNIKNAEVKKYKDAIIDTTKQIQVSCIHIPYLDSDNQLYKTSDHVQIGNKFFYCDSYRLAYELIYVIILNTILNLIAEDATRNIDKISKKGHQIHLHTMYRPIESKGEYTDRRNGNSHGYKADWSKCQTFIKNISKTFEFTLSNLYNCKSQGYDISVNEKDASHMKLNANMSINSSKTRVFRSINQLNNFKKTAIIVGTSVKLDDSTPDYGNNDYENTQPYKSLIYGEIVLITSSDGKMARIRPFEKYHEFTDEQRIHKSPEVFKDIVSRLHSLGFNNIIYLVKAPYTTKMFEKPDDTQMYFMNEDILKSMSSVNENINIYPLYINSIRTFNCDENSKPVMYSCDAEHIGKILFNDNRGMFPILQLNIHNPVNKNSEHINYSSLLTYSTISKMYKDSRLDASTTAIKNDNELKAELLSILSAYHASRYEKYSGKKPSSIKKDPYEYLIGNKSIGRNNAVDYQLLYGKAIPKKLEFNYLGLGCSIFRSINSL